MGPAARVETLDLLLQENHGRANAEPSSQNGHNMASDENALFN
jgi:hypothetical protein